MTVTLGTDAGYGYAFYDKPRAAGIASIPPGIDLDIDVDKLQRTTRELLSTADFQKRAELFNQAATALLQVRGDVQSQEGDIRAAAQNAAQLDSNPVNAAILAGMDSFTKVSAPILAIYADPHSGIPVPAGLTKATAAEHDKASVEAQIAALQRYNPSAQIVRLPNAIHYLYVSNESDVLEHIHRFVDQLPSSPRSK